MNKETSIIPRSGIGYKLKITDNLKNDIIANLDDIIDKYDIDDKVGFIKIGNEEEFDLFLVCILPDLLKLKKAKRYLDGFILMADLKTEGEFALHEGLLILKN